MGNFLTFFDTLKYTLINTWPMLVLFIVILTVVRLSNVIINKEKFVFYQDFYRLLGILYILLLYYLLLTTEGASRGVNFIPFTEMTRYSLGSKSFFYNVIGNIALFIPFGFFVTGTVKAKKISEITIITLIISLTAELIQYRIGRAFDVDDIILNTTGSILGFAIYSGISGIASKLPKFLQNNIFYNILAVLVLIGIVLLLSIALFGTGWF
jgi:glycopeptide antibiotics resistance protein